MSLSFDKWLSECSIKVVVTVALAFGALILGRLAEAQEKLSKEKPVQRPLRLSPAELFPGELKALEPHFGLTASGCIKLDCSVPKLPEGATALPLPIQLRLQIWKNGKAKNLFAMSPTLRDSHDLSITTREVPHAKDRVRYRVTTAVGGKGGSSFTREDIPLPKTEKSFMVVRKLSRQIEVKKGSPVAVWVMTYENGMGKAADKTFEQAAQRAEWALLLSVALVENK